MHLSQKQKAFSELFCALFKSKLNFKQFQKKITLIAYVFPKYGLRKTWLDKCVKSLASENPLTGNVVNGPKHCFDLNDSTFTIFIDHCEGH